jgi:hypothetical protein
MRRIFLLLAICLVTLSFSPYVARSTAQQRTQLGGRPGEFHFILKDQADHNRAEFREMQVRLERMRTDVIASASSEAVRKRMLSDLDGFQLFVTSMEAQLNSPAGQTAGEVEAHLNGVKGQANCGMCHEGSSLRFGR